MTYWRILLDDGRTGWQVMDADLGGAVVVDDDNASIEGNYGYHVADTTTRPTWAV